MTGPVLKVVAEPTLDGPREELRLAILDVEQAKAAAAKSQAAVDLASDHLRADGSWLTSGLKSSNDLSRRNAAIAAWTQFAEVITKDAGAAFPS